MAKNRSKVALRAAVLSLAALVAVVIGAMIAPDIAAQFEILLWLLAILPAFLLAYYRGWSGVATALAVGMVLLVLLQASAPFFGQEIGNWPLLLRVFMIFLGTSIGIGTLSELLHRARARLDELELTDELTSLPNRRYSGIVLEREFAAAERGRPLSVVLFDLDDFHQYRQTHGNKASDEVLKKFGEVLQGATRRMNFSARHGDTQFLSILSAGEEGGAVVFANRVQQAFATALGGADRVTVSVGIASYGSSMGSVDALLQAADRALFKAQRTGRGAVSVYEPPETTAQTQVYLDRIREILGRSKLQERGAT